MTYVRPKVFSKSFTCPHCNVLAMQDWWTSAWRGISHFTNSQPNKNPLRIACCQHCSKATIWVEETMYYPDNSNSILPNQEMPESVLNLYNEADAIRLKSPRGAAALLRLCLHVLCKELGEKGENINTDIGNLVKKGLPKIVQQSLDIVRVTGNDAVHPGQIDTDNIETVEKLFELINIIIQYMIELPQKVGEIYSNLPSEKISGITQRDSK